MKKNFLIWGKERANFAGLDYIQLKVLLGNENKREKMHLNRMNGSAHRRRTLEDTTQAADAHEPNTSIHRRKNPTP